MIIINKFLDIMKSCYKYTISKSVPPTFLVTMGDISLLDFVIIENDLGYEHISFPSADRIIIHCFYKNNEKNLYAYHLAFDSENRNKKMEKYIQVDVERYFRTCFEFLFEETNYDV